MNLVQHIGKRIGSVRRVALRVAAISVALAGTFIVPGRSVVRALGAVSNPDAVLATVGDHQITEREVDQEIFQRILHSVDATKLYEWRKEAIDDMVDSYLIEQAAKKAGMSPDEFIRHETSAKPMTEADARKYYEDHKAQIQAQTKQSFDEIKPQLIAALERQEQSQRREQMMAKLRAGEPVKVLLVEPRVKVESGGHPWNGGKDAPVTVVEFSDFQCPFCRAAESSIKAIKEKYGDKIRLVYLDFPLGMHPHAMDAARAGRCAGEQGKFWQFHDAMFANQAKLAPADLKAQAKQLGLDTKAFDTCFDGNKYDVPIHKDMSQGESLGVTATPTFFINGREVVGAQPPEKFEEVIDEELAHQNGAVNPSEAAKN